MVRAPFLLLVASAECDWRTVRDVAQCGQCVNSDNCNDDFFCCPMMKKCIASSADFATEACIASGPFAECSPPRHEPVNNGQCHEDYPDNWITDCPTALPSPPPTDAPPVPAPQCEDENPSCVDKGTAKCTKNNYKNKCKRTCGTCDGDDSGSEECTDKDPRTCIQGRGKCNKNNYKKKCKRTCDACNEEEACEDKQDKKSKKACKKADANKCSKDKFNQKCKRTCGSCRRQLEFHV